MLSIDSHEYFNRWNEKPADRPADGWKPCSGSEWKKGEFDETLDLNLINYLLANQANQSGLSNAMDDDFYAQMDFGIGIDSYELEPDKNSYDYFKHISPLKTNVVINYDDYYVGDKNSMIPDPLIKLGFERQTVSPDSGIEQDGISISFDECANVFSIMEQDKDLDGMCEPVKLNNDTEMEKFIVTMYTDKNKYIDMTPEDSDDVPDISVKPCSVSPVMSNEYVYSSYGSEPHQNPTLNSLNTFDQSKIDSVSSYSFSNGCTIKLEQPHEEMYSTLTLLENDPVNLDIKEEVCKEFYILQNDSKTIQREHNYHKKPFVIESDEDDVEPVKKRKRDEVDEDFSPYQKPKRKPGRPRTNFSKAVTPKTPRITQKTTPQASRRAPQAAKKSKNCSSVPYDRREQHNQAERERRDMLKKNLDIVEDATPDHILQLTQTALQTEKTGKPDEFENNENNFTVDVLKKLDELVKREPFNHRPKYKKASRNSKMVVLLGSTYYISSLEKELKAKENRLAQLKKQYEECLKRLKPTRVSNKRIKRYY